MHDDAEFRRQVVKLTLLLTEFLARGRSGLPPFDDNGSNKVQDRLKLIVGEIAQSCDDVIEEE